MFLLDWAGLRTDRPLGGDSTGLQSHPGWCPLTIMWCVCFSPTSTSTHSDDHVVSLIRSLQSNWNWETCILQGGSPEACSRTWGLWHQEQPWHVRSTCNPSRSLSPRPVPPISSAYSPDPWDLSFPNSPLSTMKLQSPEYTPCLLMLLCPFGGHMAIIISKIFFATQESIFVPMGW